MKRTARISLCLIGGILFALLITVSVLLCLGFRFSPNAAVYGTYQDNTHIHTSEYDFYLDDVINSENGEPCYATGHVAVKRYGFLYKEIDLPYQILVAENGDSVGYLFTYEGKEQSYNFIHWTMFIDGTINPPKTDNNDGSVSAYTKMKYCTNKIILNGLEKELYQYCYFVANEPLESVVIKGTSAFIVNGPKEGKYWTDENVMVINIESDVAPEQIIAHYENGGIIVVRNRSLSNDVQGIIKDTVVPESDEKDLATVFCKTKSGISFISTIQGNTSDLESEIDDMVASAKSKQ